MPPRSPVISDILFENRSKRDKSSAGWFFGRMKMAPLILLVGLGMAADGAWGGEAVVNSLGMTFVAVPGTKIWMCVHETRKGDYAAYAKEQGFAHQTGN